MRMLNGRVIPSTQVADWSGPRSPVPVPSARIPDPRAWTWADPLSSLSTLTAGGGTWTINGGVLECTPADNVNSKIRTNSTSIDTSKDIHVIEVELKASSAFASCATAHWGFGFNDASFGAQLTFGEILYDGAHKVALLSDNVAWRNSAAVTFTADQWYRLRLGWDDTTDTWTIWRDGVQLVSQVLSQVESPQFPTLLCYRYQGTAPTFNYRNLRYWGGAAGAQPPPL